MSAIEPEILVTALLFVLTLAFGVWLGRFGKPYHSMLFNVHKLVALGAVVATAITLDHLRTDAELTALPLGAIVVTGVLVIGLFISGALMSIGKPNHVAVLMVHRVALLLVTVSGGMAIYLLA